MKYAWTRQTPLCTMTLVEEDGALIEARFDESKPSDATLTQTPLLERAFAQLDAYFAGTLHAFDLPLSPKGTAFQLAVWRALQAIPYGATASYGQIAAAIGNPKAARAVGMANNHNPLPIFIPCHRVIGANGAMVGYGAGLPIKERLLTLERA